MSEPIIEFEGYRVESINYKRIEISEEDVEFEIKNSIECGINSECTRGIVTILLSVIDPDEMRELHIEVSGFFKLSDQIKSKEEAYKHLGVNGVAIVYPYVRSFSSLLTTLDSDKAIIVPTINTKDFYDSLSD